MRQGGRKLISKESIEANFYNIYKKMISIKEFENWVYRTPEIELFYGEELYFSLIDLNYNQKNASRDVMKLLEEHIPFAYFEYVRLTSCLQAISNEEKIHIGVLEQLYEDYCRGYSFLRFIGLSCVGAADDPDLAGHDLTHHRKEFYWKMKCEADRLLGYLKNGDILLTGEYQYTDNRSEEDRIEFTNIGKLFQI
ncbi:hypothetical protein ACTSEZ_16220 [Metabacillus sp. JX24]|uniref:hypothetical protein n=1 Tax=Metabacillus sp. JX24 TaxID=3240759 RepID=UPI003510027F